MKRLSFITGALTTMLFTTNTGNKVFRKVSSATGNIANDVFSSGMKTIEKYIPSVKTLFQETEDTDVVVEDTKDSSAE